MSVKSKKPFISGLVEGSLDAKVYQDVLRSYAKESISFLGFGNLGIANVSPETISRAEFTEAELTPFHKNDIVCESHDERLFIRKPSVNSFSAKKIKFADIETLLVNAFSPSNKGNRPYPSAGGLYPVEPLVFIFAERLDNAGDIASGCYHFRAISKKLQLIKKLSLSHFLEKLLHGFIAEDSAPCFCILYLAHIGKSIFKYRYRGYRHALMEAGSMYQQAGVISEKMELRNTVWSTFSDYEILYEIGLNYGTYMPLTMQFFGYSEAQ